MVARGSAAGLIGCSALQAATCAALYRLERFAVLGPLRNLAATLVCSVPHAVAVWLAARPPRSGTGKLGPPLPCGRLDPPLPYGRLRDAALLLGGMVVVRLSIPLPLLEGSDDAYRYLWDGLVQSHGMNPFAHPPQAPQLSHLADPVFFGRIYRPDMRTVYPPLAQLWFLVAYWLTPTSFVGLKLVLLLHDIVSVALLMRLLARIGLPARQALVYAWSPLVVVQVFAGGHLDGLLVPWLLLSLLVAAQRRLLAGVALGAAAMVRPLAIFCLPSLMLHRSSRKEALTVLSGCLVAVALLVLPFASAGAGLFESLMTYASRWRFNGSLFLLAEGIFGARQSVRIVVYALVAGGCIVAARLRLSLAGRYLAALGLYLALSPTVYPWYLVSLIGIAAIFPRPLTVLLPALSTLSDLVFLERRTSGRWRVPTAAHLLEYGLIYGLLSAELLRYRRQDREREQRRQPRQEAIR